ncbi:MAG: class I SAM-dependent methyltransferase [Pseudomonadota bacterium]
MTADLYNEIAYPTAIFAQAHPDRLAMIARVVGLSPPDIASARVLEIGGGDGMNVIAMAVSYPHGDFTNFDLAAEPIARGQAWVERLGLNNCKMLELDILGAAEQLEGEFDYIIAHGVYAWVPPRVAEALLALIGRKLSPDGVAFVSYNAMPGGHLRTALRDDVLAHVGDVEDEATFERRATERLEQLAQRGGDKPNALQLALRDAAAKCLNTEWGVLRHDELGPFFHPQSLTDFVSTAQRHGLGFLGEGQRQLCDEAILPEALAKHASDPDATHQLVRHLQRVDHEDLQFFRQTLLVRADKQVPRRLNHAALGNLYVASLAEHVGDAQFRRLSDVFEIRDEGLAKGLLALTERRPYRMKGHKIADTPERLEALFRMFASGLVELHTAPAPCATTIPSHPVASPLVRATLAAGMERVFTLDHRMVSMSEADPRALLAQLDGSRHVDDLLNDGPIGAVDDPEKLQAALAKSVSEALIMPADKAD